MDNLQPQEVLGIDPRFQGVWYPLILSTDGGKTPTGRELVGKQFCRVFATKIRLAGGQELIVDKVFYSEFDGLMRYFVLFLGTPHVWVLTDLRPNAEQGVMFQIIDTRSDQEIIRGMCRVQV